MSSYLLHMRCLKCGHKYKRTVKASNREAVDNVPDPPCPKCKTKKKRAHKGLSGIVAAQSGPGINGNNVAVKAIDETAKIVMEDYGMSDLRTNTREGDVMVPQLTPSQRKMNENFWGGKRGQRPLTDGRAMVSQAMQGQFLPGKGAKAGEGAVSGNEVLTELHRNRVRPKTTIIASHKPE